MGKNLFAPDSGIMTIQYGKSRLRSKDGIIHTVPAEAEPPKKKYRSQKMLDKEAFEISICLNCPLKKCDGSPECFRRRKREVQGK